MWECTRLLVVYAAAFLGLISIAVAVPLVRGGAPLWDVLLFLPNQLAFPATLAIPLALVTATLATIGRLREDGELVALMSAGVSAMRVARSLLPIVLLTAILVAWLAHSLMPVAYRNFAAGKSSLLRQAMATKVARQEPIFQRSDQFGLEQTSMAALNASGDRLGHLFAWRFTADGRLWIAYAPQARWASRTVEGGVREDVFSQLPDEVRRKIGVVVEEEGPQTITSLELDLTNARLLHHTVDPDSMTRGTGVGDDFGDWDFEEDRVEIPGVEPANSSKFAIPYPVTVGTVPAWSVSLDNDDAGPSMPADGKDTKDLIYEVSRISENLAIADLSSLPANVQDDLLRTTYKRLRSHQFALHLRFMLPVAVIAYWLFASGLALSIPARSRLTAVAIGLVTVIITVLPAFAVVKGAGGRLGMHPGWLLWVPVAALAVIGLWMTWRRR
jgi:lipopolysaccharide export LptBFGC system permease protein LptF